MKPLNDKIVLSAESGKCTDDSFIFIIFFRGFGLVLAVTGKWFLSYVSFGSIPGIAVKDYKKIKKGKPSN